ncbi:MAG TPA: NfeD family protein, partial [Solirubrobacteraceae bacterium]
PIAVAGTQQRAADGVQQRGGHLPAVYAGDPAIAREYDGQRAMVLLGIALLGIGAGLLIAEAHVPSFGALGLAGVIALVAGTAIAVDGSGGGIALVVVVAAIVAAASLALVAVIARATLKAARPRALTGAEGLVGHVGVVRSAPAPLGQVFIDGALWRAKPCMQDELEVGDPVVVERVQGLVLSVRRAEEWEIDP